MKSEESGQGESSNPSEPSSSASEDIDLKMLNAKRLIELRRRAVRLSSVTKEKTSVKESSKESQYASAEEDRKIVMRALIERGDEVLMAAESSYPRQTAALVHAIADLIRKGKVSTITGGELLQFFRSLGMRVSVPTSITVQEHGKFVSLADKLKRETE
jgi:hypothetical protein